MTPLLPSYDLRLEELRRLGPGWLDADTPAISQAALDTARRFLAFGDTARNFHTYPTPTGGIQIEWDGEGGGEYEIAADGSAEFRWDDQ